MSKIYKIVTKSERVTDQGVIPAGTVINRIVWDGIAEYETDEPDCDVVFERED